MSYSKYYLYKKQYSTDNGVTWYDVTPAEQVPSGNPIGTYSTLSECESDVPHDYSGDYLTFVAVDSGTFTFYQEGKGTLQYSTDSGSTWTTLTNTQNTHATTVSVAAGNKILWKGTLYPDDRDYKEGYRIGQFDSTGRYNIEGNLVSITANGPSSSGGMAPRMYEGLFSYNKVVNAGNMVLPDTVMANYCYASMFFNCTYLTTPPSILPATTLAAWCYQFMFGFCSSLTTAPELPAATLVNSCYDTMFSNCSSLSYVKCLATDISASNCTNSWLYNVASSGTFVKNSSMSGWGNCSPSKIPCNWTVQNAS